MTAVALRCDACGGVVRVHGPAIATCVFCGESRRLAPAALPDDGPAWRAPLQADEDWCRARFDAWRNERSQATAVRSLRTAALEIRLVWVPAQRFRGRLRTRWIGTVRDGSRPSGRRPVTGVDEDAGIEAYVPASRALSPATLRGLGPFGEEFQPVDPDAVAEPVEVSGWSERWTRAAGVAELSRRHAALLRERHGLEKVEVLSVDEEVVAERVLLPVWIGSWPVRGRRERWLVNGVTRVVVGQAPTSQVWLVVLGGLLLSIGTANPLPLGAALLFWLAVRVGLVHD